MKLGDSFFQSIIESETGHYYQIISIDAIAGGDINEAYKVTTHQKAFFIKTNTPQISDMFQKEALGIELLRESKTIVTPHVIGHGTAHNKPYILQEFISKGYQKPDFWETFGQQLANLHRVTQPQFGLDHHNYIGRLHQSNTLTDSWTDFFIHQRLIPQLELAQSHNLIEPTLRSHFEQLFTKLDTILPTYPPSLLHGDLWSGNFMINETGEPCIFDPAVYFGNREIEIAFTRLFGGFDSTFYHSYQNCLPLETGFEERIPIYNLYPLLVHVNLFGPSYLSGIKQTIGQFI